jgi:RimJ/RimL family protein N-acetyltransferase
VVGGEAVGGIGLRMQDDIHKRSAEIGFWLGEEHWGQGIMTDAVKAVADHAFRHLDVCRIYALVFEHNAASARVLEKSGFVSEARLRKGATKNGTTFDELLYALVR